MVEVTQADREAAIKIFAMIFGNGHSATYALARSDRHFLFDELARHRIAALEEAATELERQDGHGEWSEAATAIPTLRARIAELEQRLEIDPAQPYDGIETRDATIIALETYKENLRDEVVELRAKIAELEAERAEWVEVARLRMGKV
jgi:chromosome segregation ATPase